MNKFLCTFLVFSLVFAMTSCGNSVQEVVSEKAESKSESKSERREENPLKNNTQFDFETKTVTLNSGYEMPIYGLGTYSLTGAANGCGGFINNAFAGVYGGQQQR